MSEYNLLSTLMENKIIDRRLLKMVEKVFQKVDRKAKLIKMEEFSNGRFQTQIEGQVRFSEDRENFLNNPRTVKKIEDELEKIGFAEFRESGQTVMGAELEGDKDDRDVLFIIELDQD